MSTTPETPAPKRASWHDWPTRKGWWYDAELDNWMKIANARKFLREYFAPQPPRRWFGPWIPPNAQLIDEACAIVAKVNA